MKTFNITVNGTAYNVTVEETASGPGPGCRSCACRRPRCCARCACRRRQHRRCHRYGSDARQHFGREGRCGRFRQGR